MIHTPRVRHLAGMLLVMEFHSWAPRGRGRSLKLVSIGYGVSFRTKQFPSLTTKLNSPRPASPLARRNPRLVFLLCPLRLPSCSVCPRPSVPSIRIRYLCTNLLDCCTLTSKVSSFQIYSTARLTRICWMEYFLGIFFSLSCVIHYHQLQVSRR